MTQNKFFDLSRRNLLMGGAALAVGTFALPGSVLAESTPKKGGTLRYGVNDGSENDTLDPATWATVMAGLTFNGAMFSNLVELLPDGKLRGELATSWEAADSATRWTFILRKGVKFHDGRLLRPEDVRQSILHHMGEGSTSGAITIVSQIADIAVEGEDRVAFTLKKGNAGFPALMTDIHLSIFPAREGGGIDWKSGIGTGPFKLDNFQPGISARLVRNPDYYKPGLPYFDTIEVINITDTGARLNALLTGEVDVIEDVDIRNAALIERNPALKVVRTPSYRHLTFDMNCQVAPYDNPAVRRALKLAIDRDDIIAKVFLGDAKKGNDNPIATNAPYYVATPPQYTYDPDAARALLKEAGLSDVKVDLSVADVAFPGAIDAAVLFQQQAAKAGITVNVIREADDGYWDNVWLKKPFNACDWSGRVTLDLIFGLCYTSDAPWNNTGFHNARFDELQNLARPELDETKRAKLYAEMQQILHDDGGVITVAFMSWRLGMSANIGHGMLGGINPADNHRATERWWREDA